MMNEKDFERLADFLDATLDANLAPIMEKLDKIKETCSDTRAKVEALAEWADNVTVLIPAKIPVRKPE